MMMRRMLGMTAILFAALLSFASPVSAQTSGNTSVGGSDTTPTPGQTITVTGSGCPANSPVNFFFDDQAAGSTTADGNGDFSGQATVPSNASSGTHTVTAQCGAVVMGFQVEVSPAGTAAAAIPRTGSSTTIPLASIALALLAVGGLFVLFARRRRVSHSVA
jgi:LPXTG-motif cell wall-anchored protein